MTETPTLMQRIAGRGPLFGCWLEMFSPIAAEVVAQADYDCVLIDPEHGPGSDLDAVALMHAVQGRACAPLLRVPSNGEVALKRALDIGVAAVEGVDLLFVGPFDLSAGVGHVGKPDHPEVRAMIARVEAAAQAAGKRLGAIPTPGRSVEELVAAGYGLIMVDADVLLLRDAARASLAKLRAEK